MNFSAMEWAYLDFKDGHCLNPFKKGTTEHEQYSLKMGELLEKERIREEEELRHGN